MSIILSGYSSQNDKLLGRVGQKAIPAQATSLSFSYCLYCNHEQMNPLMSPSWWKEICTDWWSHHKFTVGVNLKWAEVVWATCCLILAVQANANHSLVPTVFCNERKIFRYYKWKKGLFHCWAVSSIFISSVHPCALPLSLFLWHTHMQSYTYAHWEQKRPWHRLKHNNRIYL